MSVYSEIQTDQPNWQTFMEDNHFCKSAGIRKNKHSPFLSSIEFRVEALGDLYSILCNPRLNSNHCFINNWQLWCGWIAPRIL